MANIDLSLKPSLITQTPPTSTMTPDLTAGEDLPQGVPCYIKASDNKVYRCNGAAADEKALCSGWTNKPYKAGQAVVLRHGVEFGSFSGLSGGALYYVGATVGTVSDAPTTGGTLPIMQATSATTARVFRSVGN